MANENEEAVVVEEQGKPKTFKEAVQAFEVKVTDEDESALLLQSVEAGEREERIKRAAENASAATVAMNGVSDKVEIGKDGFPSFVIVPEDLKFPRNRSVHFVLIPAALTDTPEAGDRQCIMWNLNDADEKLAGKRTRGESTRAIAEMTKQMIRAVDGKKVDWQHGHLANIEKWWNDIGARFRNNLASIYYKSHHLSAAEQADFFSRCYAVRTVKTA